MVLVMEVGVFVLFSSKEITFQSDRFHLKLGTNMHMLQSNEMLTHCGGEIKGTKRK